MPPRSSWILFWFLLTVFKGALRFALKDVLLNLRSTQNKLQWRVAIYGAGEAGVQLAASLGLVGNHRIVTFLEENPTYWDRAINGVAIQPLQKLTELDVSIDQVLLAIPSLSRSERRRSCLCFLRAGLEASDVGVPPAKKLRRLTPHPLVQERVIAAAMVFGDK